MLTDITDTIRDQNQILKKSVNAKAQKLKAQKTVELVLNTNAEKLACMAMSIGSLKDKKIELEKQLQKH